jgi:transcriptional regulator with XRE-family HTH domain
MRVGDGPSPVVQLRRLRAELRKAREEACLTQEQVAGAMEWSPSKVIRIEAGISRISANDLKVLLPHLGIVDKKRTEELLELARRARARSWWSSEYRGIASKDFLQFVEYEEAAAVTSNFEPLLVPGLLQTEEYARAVIRQFGQRPTTERVNALVELRMTRQELLQRPDSPQLNFILDEAVVRRLVGGKTVMGRQVRHIMQIASMPKVMIEVVPFSAGVHPGMHGPFVVIEFPDPEDADVLYLENPRGDVVKFEVPEDVQAWQEAFLQLRAMSLGPEGSVTYLGKVADEMS